MKRIFLILLLAITAFSFSAQAQRAADVELKDRIWYGAHVDFGFSASQNQSFFAFGLAPMLGYKITPSLSVGPRAKILYNNYRFRDFGNNLTSFNPVTWGVGIFSRIRVYQGFFAQGELGYDNTVDYFDSNANVVRISGLNAHLGAGINRSASGRIGYEMMLAYDLNLIGKQTLDLLSYRFGFTVGLY